MLVYVIIGLVVVVGGTWWGSDAFYAHQKRVDRGDYVKLRIVNDENFFRVQVCDQKWFRNWRNLESDNSYRDIEGAKSRLVQATKNLAQKRHDYIDQEARKLAQQQTRDKELREAQEFARGMDVESIKKIIPEEFV